jgi:predicted lipoprotein with Yx(FWY)xxD motif
VSLYDFVNDTPTTSNCVGACATSWPPLTGTATAGTGVTGSMITTITRPDGTKQVAYNGHPLYYYRGDSAAGQTNGQGLNLNGGLWWLLTPAGAELKTSH